MTILYVFLILLYMSIGVLVFYKTFSDRWYSLYMEWEDYCFMGFMFLLTLALWPIGLAFYVLGCLSMWACNRVDFFCRK